MNEIFIDFPSRDFYKETMSSMSWRFARPTGLAGWRMSMDQDATATPVLLPVLLGLMVYFIHGHGAGVS